MLWHDLLMVPIRELGMIKTAVNYVNSGKITLFKVAEGGSEKLLVVLISTTYQDNESDCNLYITYSQ